MEGGEMVGVKVNSTCDNESPIDERVLTEESRQRAKPWANTQVCPYGNHNMPICRGEPVCSPETLCAGNALF
jgi:hypothetical protein